MNISTALENILKFPMLKLKDPPISSCKIKV